MTATTLPEGPIDLHAHFVAPAAFDLAGTRIDSERADSESVTLVVGERSRTRVPAALLDPERQVADMAAMGVTHSVVSPPPFLFRYGDDPAFTVAFAAAQNAGIAELVRADPERFSGLATVPLQAPEAAADMLTEAVQRLGLSGVEIGTNVAGSDLDDPSFEPFWERAEALGALVFIHPSDVRAVPDDAPYYLRNLSGNLIETAYCLSRLIYGGVLARHRELRILAAHAGGFLPYTIGRLDHGYRVRPECAAALAEPPSHYFERLFFDTITHGTPALRYLVELVGPERMALGSDYPFDMGDPRPLGQLDALDLAETRRQIASETARHLLRPSRPSEGGR